jgi:hypothetical protein
VVQLDVEDGTLRSSVRTLPRGDKASAMTRPPPQFGSHGVALDIYIYQCTSVGSQRYLSISYRWVEMSSYDPFQRHLTNQIASNGEIRTNGSGRCYCT